MLAQLVFLLYACGTTAPGWDSQPTDSSTPDESDTDTDTDSDSDADSDTDNDTDSDADADVVPELSWTLDKDIQTLATVSWTQPFTADGYVEYRFDEDWRSSPRRSFEAGSQEQLLLGIPYETQADVRLVYDASTGATTQEIRLATGALPANLPVPSLKTSIPEMYEPTGNYLLGSINADSGGWTGGEYWMFIVDRQGRVVWAMRAEDDDFTIYLHVSRDNDILWDVSTFWSDWDMGAGSEIHRMKIDGKITATYPAPGMHHCFTELPDGSIIWGSATSGAESLLRRYLDDDSVETVWDCEPFYDELGLNDWCHTNSIFYHEPTNTVLMSFPTNDTFILEIDLDSGQEIRWFGHIPESWDFDYTRSEFQYQHGVTYTDEGTLLMSSQLTPRDDDGVVREYELDEENQVLRQIWMFGAGDGIDASYAGEAHRLPNGNTLHNTGTTPRVREITPDDQVVWDLLWSGYRLLGRTIFVEDLYDLAP